MTGMQGMSGGKDVKEASGIGGSEIVLEESSVFGIYSDEQLVTQLKALAVDPCYPENDRSDVRPLWNQIIRVRKAMALADQHFPRRKRQLQQFVKDKLNTHPGSKSASPSLSNNTKLARGMVSHASSKSCLLNSVLSAESIDQKNRLEAHSANSFLSVDSNCQMKQISIESSFMCNATKRTSIGKDMPYFVDSDESVSYSNPLSPENSIPPEVPSSNLDEISHTSNSKVLKKRNQRHLPPVRPSSSLSKLIGDHLRKMTVPVGPRFQADVPDWIDPCHNKNSNSGVLRWLGIKIWPCQASTPKPKAGAVGKGRPERCSCNTPTSVECIKRHVLEATLYLQRDLGTVFRTWKFDEIGNHASNSWTLQEQKKFESLVARMKQKSNEKNFLKDALKCFPLKCRKTIVNYYFSVYIPRRMSLQRRPPLKEVDSDGDEVEDCNISDMKLNGKSKNLTNVKKNQYLRRPS